MGQASSEEDVTEMSVEYRWRLFEETGVRITADGGDGNLVINLEGVKTVFSFMDMDITPEPLEDVLSLLPAPADDDDPPGSSNEDDDPG